METYMHQTCTRSSQHLFHILLKLEPSLPTPPPPEKNVQMYIFNFFFRNSFKCSLACDNHSMQWSWYLFFFYLQVFGLWSELLIYEEFHSALHTHKQTQPQSMVQISRSDIQLHRSCPKWNEGNIQPLMAVPKLYGFTWKAKEE